MLGPLPRLSPHTFGETVEVTTNSELTKTGLMTGPSWCGLGLDNTLHISIFAELSLSSSLSLPSVWYKLLKLILGGGHNTRTLGGDTRQAANTHTWTARCGPHTALLKSCLKSCQKQPSFSRVSLLVALVTGWAGVHHLTGCLETRLESEWAGPAPVFTWSRPRPERPHRARADSAWLIPGDSVCCVTRNILQTSIAHAQRHRELHTLLSDTDGQHLGLAFIHPYNIHLDKSDLFYPLLSGEKKLGKTRPNTLMYYFILPC